jgi:hypothetical protein
MGDATTAGGTARPRTLRVAMVSPYSLSVPGGVQAQVMGLSRELRSMGIEVRVLAPCDGPPPATFVTPLGKSLPTSANGSIAPLAPDPSAQLRTIRALTDEDFDILHLHEPFTPGPTQTALLMHTAPVIATSITSPTKVAPGMAAVSAIQASDGRKAGSIPMRKAPAPILRRWSAAMRAASWLPQQAGRKVGVQNG